MQVGDLVSYIPYGHDNSDGSVGIIVSISDEGYYDVYWPDIGVIDLVFSELEVVCKQET